MNHILKETKIKDFFSDLQLRGPPTSVKTPITPYMCSGLHWKLGFCISSITFTCNFVEWSSSASTASWWELCPSHCWSGWTFPSWGEHLHLHHIEHLNLHRDEHRHLHHDEHLYLHHDEHLHFHHDEHFQHLHSDELRPQALHFLPLITGEVTTSNLTFRCAINMIRLWMW